MKSLIKGGLFLALGWLASTSGADEIQWKRSIPKTSETPAGPAERAIRVGQPAPLDVSPPSSIIRAQAPDDKTVPPLPKLEKLEKFEIIVGEPGQPKPLPKEKTFQPIQKEAPKENGKDKPFTPPTPTPLNPAPRMPSPVFDSLGMGDSCGGCGDISGARVGHGYWTDGLDAGWGGCCGADGCPDRGRLWVSAEYLLWWQKQQNVPPLVVNNPLGRPAFLDDPGTVSLFNSTNDHTRAGGRFTLGGWLPGCCDLGLESTFFFLGRDNTHWDFPSNGGVQTVRPFFNVNKGRFDGELFNGLVSINSYSELWGFETNLRKKWLCGPDWYMDVVVGYRYLNLSEGLDITERTIDNVTIPGTPISVTERESFHTRTLFNGGQIGIDGDWHFWNRWVLGYSAKVALGDSYQTVYINGNTTFLNVPNPPGNSIQNGALLAGPTNNGRFSTHRFAVVPEVGLKIGYDVTDNLRIFVGYDFLYLSSAMRPSEQINLNVNPSFRPTIFGPGAGAGPRQPAVLLHSSDYWAQGLNFGLQYKF